MPDKQAAAAIASGLEGIEAATGIDVASKIIKFIEDNAHVRSMRRDRIRV